MSARPELILSAKLSYALQLLADAHDEVVTGRSWGTEPLPNDIGAPAILDLPVPLTQTPTHRTGDLTAI